MSGFVVKARRVARALLEQHEPYAAIGLCDTAMHTPWRLAELALPDWLIIDGWGAERYAFWHEVIYQITDMEKEKEVE